MRAGTVDSARSSLELGRFEGRIVLAAVAVVQTLRLRSHITSPGLLVSRNLRGVEEFETPQTDSIIRGGLYN